MSSVGDEPVFGSRDARVEYGGKGVGGSKNVSKKKPANQISANFKTPMVPKGEKTKKKVAVSPVASSGVIGGGENHKGECYIVVCDLVLLCYFGAGAGRCRMCKGHFCAVVNDLLNVLIEYGEVEPDEEVLIAY